MANLFVDLPFPVLNGAGAAVDTSAMGKSKTVQCTGSFPGVTVTVQVSEDGGNTWAPLITFQSSGEKKTKDVAAQYMRVHVKGRKSGVPFSANCDVGANDNGGNFVVLPMPVGDGNGAPVDVSALGNFTTIVVGGSFKGALVTVESSEDGVDYAACGAGFQSGNSLRNREVIANWMRVNVKGTKTGVTFTAIAAVGAINDPITVGGVGGLDRYAPPEKWHQENVADSQAEVDLSALMSVSFDSIKAIRAGSIVGLSTRFTEALTDATANSAIVKVTINGVGGSLQIAHSSGVNPSGGQAVQAAAIDTFVAGDLLGIEITTLQTFTPVTTDVEAWMDLEF
jgi:hypothetical protein